MLQPLTSCSACSIFNVSQLTAAHTGSLVKNATHASTPGCQAHALVVPLRTGPANTLRRRGGSDPLHCLWLTVALVEKPGWYLYFTGRLRARWSRMASSDTPGIRPTWVRSPGQMRLSFRAGGFLRGHKLPLRLLTKGIDTAAAPLWAPLQTWVAELWFSLADLYWSADSWIWGLLFAAKWRGVKISS